MRGCGARGGCLPAGLVEGLAERYRMERKVGEGGITTRHLAVANWFTELRGAAEEGR